MVDKVIRQDSAYKGWLSSLKGRLRQVQLKAAVSVNRELLQFYWELGAEIVEKQKNAQWGSGFLKQLSQDLQAEFPEVKGFSLRNIKYIRQWYYFFSVQQSIGQQAVAQLAPTILEQVTSIPWGHNLVIISKCESMTEALYYVNKTNANGWSRSVLTHQIESKLWQREGKAISNFSETLPALQSDLAQQVLKDPYTFDFLTLTQQYNERELEQGLVDHITSFLLTVSGEKEPVANCDRFTIMKHSTNNPYVFTELGGLKVMQKIEEVLGYGE